MSHDSPYIIRSERRRRQRTVADAPESGPVDAAANLDRVDADPRAYNTSARLRKVAPRHYLGYLSTRYLTKGV